MHDLENSIMVYSLKHNEPIPIILHIAFINMDQIERRPATNHSGNNSDWGPRCGRSCNLKTYNLNYLLVKRAILN